jgi:hypothetical protein
MPSQDIPKDADPVFREVMRAVRTGKNPEKKRLDQLDAKKQKLVKDAMRKRKGKHTQGFQDGVIDTGMFDR